MAVLSDLLAIYLISAVIVCHCALLSCKTPECPKAPELLPDYFGIASRYLGLEGTLPVLMAGIVPVVWLEVLSLFGVIAIISENLLLVYWTVTTVQKIMNWATSLLIWLLLLGVGALVVLLYLPDGSVSLIWTTIESWYDLAEKLWALAM
mmetsp:Transcript_13918/g.26091  ORF Transcript_13918/g.26091 Transcript_13918/m.26091 type:complete len:150 (-) Transcript_13918:45-494(-)